MRIVAFTAALAAILPAAALAQVPHSFTAGAQAKASEVNENFEALDARITANETAIAAAEPYVPPLNYSVVASNSETVGQAFLAGLAQGPVQLLNVPVTIEGSMGSYHIIAVLSPDRLETPQVIYYASANCTGTAYILWGNYNTFSISHPHAVNRVTGTAVFATGAALSSPFSPGSLLSPTTGMCATTSGTLSSGVYPAEDGADFYALYPPPYESVAN